MATLEELFEQFKQIPDWNLYPMPEVFYEHFKVKKPKPTEIYELPVYNPPPYQSLNENGKVEERGPEPGGVREIKELLTLPVEVKLLKDETGELVEYPPPPTKEEVEKKQEDFLNSLYEKHTEQQLTDMSGNKGQ